MGNVQVPWSHSLGSNSSKINSRPKSLRHLLTMTPTWVSWCNGNTPKLGWNRGAVRSTKKPAISQKRCKIGRFRTKLGYHDRLIGSRKLAFDWCQNQWHWMTLNGQDALLRKKIVLRSPPEKKLNEGRRILSAAECWSPNEWPWMTLNSCFTLNSGWLFPATLFTGG